MGVIYKLKREVVDFILEQKKTLPSLSCRRLTTIVQDHFHMAVSKSAVNIVLKTNRLSSPVGRQPKSKTSKNFFIPKEKKEELRSQIAILLPAVLDSAEGHQSEATLTLTNESSSAPIEVKQKNESVNNSDTGNIVQLACNIDGQQVAPLDFVSQEGLATSAMTEAVVRDDKWIPPSCQDTKKGILGGIVGDSGAQERLSFAEKVKAQRLPEDLEAQVPEKVDVDAIVRKPEQRVRTVWDDGAVVENDNALALLLVTSLWERDKDRILAKNLARCLLGKGQKISLDLLEGVIALQQVEKDMPVEVKKQVSSSVSRLIGVDLMELEDVCQKIVDILSKDKKARFVYDSAWNTVSTEAVCFELTTFYGKKFYVDPLWTRISLEPMLNEGGVFLFHAIERVAMELINNLEPLIISMVDRQSFFTNQYFQYLPVLIGVQDDYVDKISILSKQGDSLVSFGRLPKLRRGFVMTGTILEGDLGHVDFDTIGATHNFCSPLDGHFITYHEGKLDLCSDYCVQAFVFCDTINDQDRLVVTNLRKSWVSYEAGFINNRLVDKINRFLFNQKFDISSSGNSLYIKIKNQYPEHLLPLQASVAILNRKRIINHSGQRVEVLCESTNI